MDNKLMEVTAKLGKCQAMCNYCFNACLGEDDVKMMVECIKLDKACAEICGITLSQVASSSILVKETIQLCIDACQKCEEECKKYSHQHCQDCAKACKECADACMSYM